MNCTFFFGGIWTIYAYGAKKLKEQELFVKAKPESAYVNIEVSTRLLSLLLIFIKLNNALLVLATSI